MKPFPPNFWGTLAYFNFYISFLHIEMCEQNDLEKTVIHYFTIEGFQQARSLVENSSKREMEESQASSQIVKRKIDLSGFIHEDLQQFCAISDYVCEVNSKLAIDIHTYCSMSKLSLQ